MGNGRAEQILLRKATNGKVLKLSVSRKLGIYMNVYR